MTDSTIGKGGVTMKIYMDRKWCTCMQAACERTFGEKILRWDFSPGGCIYDTVDDGKPEATFYIRDDESDKVLVVGLDEAAEAHDSWLLFWEKQQAEKVQK